MILLVPGRHHIATRFQASFLFRFFKAGFDGELDTRGDPLEGRPDTAVFAVTSADHAWTRRNPRPFHMRAIALSELGSSIGIDMRVFGIEEAGRRPDFAEDTIQTSSHASEGELDLRPDTCVVACATEVGALYEELGFRVWAAEADPRSGGEEAGAVAPWRIIERIAESPDWRKDRLVMSSIHPASYRLVSLYGLDAKIRRIFGDPLLGGDGDLTEPRDYGSYVRQMDENAEEKWRDTRPLVRPGRIGDIGCAVGSWLLRASRDARCADSDFYGVEIARPLFDICVQRRHNGEFGTPNIWFAQRDAVEGVVFKAGSMTTIHSSSLTHEIESYAGRGALLAFIANRFAELEPGGVWINRDVAGPEEADREVLLELSAEDGSNPRPEEIEAEGRRLREDREALAAWLGGLSTAARFMAFARDYRADEGYRLAFDAVEVSSRASAYRLALRDACEFLLTKDYCDNWRSEMHETFCHWSFSDWKRELSAAGFRLSDESRAWTNPWILENRWAGRARLRDARGEAMPWPPSNVLIGAIRE